MHRYLKLILGLSLFLLSENAYSGDDAFVRVRGYTDIPGSKVELRKTLAPRVEIFGAIPGCYGSSAAYVAQAFICRSSHIENCSNIPEDQQISAFSMMAWARKNAPEKPDIAASSYTNIHFGDSGVNAILNSKVTFRFKPASCYPIGKIREKYDNEEAFNNAMASLKDMFLRSKISQAVCDQCFIKAIKDYLDVSVDASWLKTAIDKPTFEEFIYFMIFKDCNKSIMTENKPEVTIFPLKGEVVRKNQVLAKIAKEFNSENPILFEGVCLHRESGKSCAEGTHSMVIIGYKKACKINDCKIILKIQNPWGESWQKSFDGGWVDGEKLVDAIDQDPVVPGLLSWYR